MFSAVWPVSQLGNSQPFSLLVTATVKLPLTSAGGSSSADEQAAVSSRMKLKG